MSKVIGILGGLGPESTALFYTKLINTIQKTGVILSNVDYPQIIINSIPAPELLLEPVDLSMYVNGLKTLETAGADFITIVCNTAQVYLSQLQSEVNIEIISLQKILSNKLQQSQTKSFTVFGSAKFINSKILIDLDFEYKKISEVDSDLLDRIILSYNVGQNKQDQLIGFNKLLTKYHGRVDTIIIACTELSSMLDNKIDHIIDTFDLLIQSTIEHWNN